MFFKSFRDQRKAQALVIHLDFAYQRFKPESLYRVTHHLAEAQKALIDLRKSGAEDYISKAGWEHVARIADLLSMNLEVYGLSNLVADANHILDFARRKAATSDVT